MRRSRPKTSPWRLTLEPLDRRDLPDGSGTGVPAGISLNAFGTLNIKGDGRADTGHVWVADGQVHATLSHLTWVNGFPVTTDDPEKVCPVAQVKYIAFYGLDGSDSFTNDTSIKCTAHGYAGNDVLVGGFAGDILLGGDGADRLEGRWGNDDLRGGAGGDTYVFAAPARGALGADAIKEDANVDADELDFSALGGGAKVNLASTVAQTVRTDFLTLTLSNGLGVEDVTGTPWADTITGNARPNAVLARGGNDNVTGASGADVLWGEGGNDLLYGNLGNDALHGGADNDKLYPGGDSNTVTDGAGDDLVEFTFNAVGVHYTTGGGNDVVKGSLFDDEITGSSGNDQLDGGAGDDVLTGGAGNDLLVGGSGDNAISDGPGDDTVDFSLNAVAVNYTASGGNDKVIGTDYADKLTGSSGNDKLYGGRGNDRLIGLGGQDQVFGEDGNDWMEPGSSGELADGGPGTDYNAHRPAVNGATYGDVMQGGAGTCLFLSALAGAAQQGANLAGRITYLGDYVFNVKLFNEDTGTSYNQQVFFDGGISIIGGKRWDPWQASPEEFWTILYQRAFLKMTTAEDLTYNDAEVATYAVTGRSVDTDDWDDPAVLANALAAGKVVTAGDADDTYMIYDDHSYTVMAVYQQSGIWYIRLRNPWGHDVEGSKTPYGTNGDGIIVLKWSSFQGYHDFDRISIS